MSSAHALIHSRKLQEAIGSLTLDIMVAPRPGKKLLVLDLDYCILDCKLWSSSAFVADRELPLVRRAAMWAVSLARQHPHCEHCQCQPATCDQIPTLIHLKLPRLRSTVSARPLKGSCTIL